MYEEFAKLVRDIFNTSDFIPLHEPYFGEEEKSNLIEAVNSTFVSTTGGGFVDRFEEDISSFIKSNHAISTVNGTSALHLSLLVLGAKRNTEVITQSLTFIATCNAITYCGANPVFIDIDTDTLSLSPAKLRYFLENETESGKKGKPINKTTKKEITACVLMNTFGFPGRSDEIKKICEEYGLNFLEDSAESLGSFSQEGHTGVNSKISILSFNGNKIITTGGGGMITTNDDKMASRIRHLSTTARIDKGYEFVHDEVGYNYRMPNINAAIGAAQIKKIQYILKQKKALASIYREWFAKRDIKFIDGLPESSPNYWLNTILLRNEKEKNDFIHEMNQKGVGVRPAWLPMHQSKPFSNCYSSDMENTNSLYQRIVNLPSSVLDSV
ncbi:LegC family aminotransferase [Gammaproteobacteria bacterium]|nr:LegC family aminotransferase [Gammaproteobacteria bacterium]